MVIGYVAARHASLYVPHLHFAIFRLTSWKRNGGRGLKGY